MAKRIRLGLYLGDEQMKMQIKVAAAKRGTTVTDYCAEAIEDRLIREGERSAARGGRAGGDSKIAFIERVEELRREIGPIGIPVWELIEEGRKR